MRRRVRRVRGRQPRTHFVKKPANLTFEQAAAVGVSAIDRAPAPSRRRQGPARAEGPDQRRIGRRRHVRRADRQGVRRRGDRRHAARRTSSWSARSAPTTSSTTPRRTSPQGAERYDLILDNVGNHSMAQTRRALTPTGRLISNGGGHVGGKLGRTVRTMLVSMFVRQQASPTVKTQNHDDLVALKELVEAGKVYAGHRPYLPARRDCPGDRSRRRRTRSRHGCRQRVPAIARCIGVG